MDYINPNSLIPNVGMENPALSGYYLSMKEKLANQMLPILLNEQALGLGNTAAKTQEYIANAPLREANRARDLAVSQTELETKPQLLRAESQLKDLEAKGKARTWESDAETKLSTNEATRSKNLIDNMERSLTILDGLSSTMDSAGPLGADYVKSAIKAMGLKPDSPIAKEMLAASSGPEAKAVVDKWRPILQNNLEQRRKMDLEAQKQAGATERQRIAAGPAYARLESEKQWRAEDRDAKVKIAQLKQTEQKKYEQAAVALNNEIMADEIAKSQGKPGMSKEERRIKELNRDAYAKLAQNAKVAAEAALLGQIMPVEATPEARFPISSGSTTPVESADSGTVMIQKIDPKTGKTLRGTIDKSELEQSIANGWKKVE